MVGVGGKCKLPVVVPPLGVGGGGGAPLWPTMGRKLSRRGAAGLPGVSPMQREGMEEMAPMADPAIGALLGRLALAQTVTVGTMGVGVA